MKNGVYVTRGGNILLIEGNNISLRRLKKQKVSFPLRGKDTDKDELDRFLSNHLPKVGFFWEKRPMISSDILRGYILKRFLKESLYSVEEVVSALQG